MQRGIADAPALRREELIHLHVKLHLRLKIRYVRRGGIDRRSHKWCNGFVTLYVRVMF